MQDGALQAVLFRELGSEFRQLLRWVMGYMRYYLMYEAIVRSS